MSSWNLPGTVTLTVALYIPSLHVLASVDTNLKHFVGCAKRYIIDGFLCSNFDVHCLGDLFANESVSKHRLDKLCRLRLGQPSDGIEKEVLFWYEAQLHLGLLCRRSRTSLRDVLRRCFSYSTFSSYSFKGLFPEWRLSEDMHLCIGHFNPGGLALVNARDMGCQQLARSVNEVLTSLWCMRVRGCYCSCHTEQCGVSFTAICFKDSDFSACCSCGTIPMRPKQQPYMCSVCQSCILALAEPSDLSRVNIASA